MLIGDSVLVCSDIFPFVHLFIKNFLCTYYGPGTVPGVGDLRDIGSYPPGASVYWGRYHTSD